jgi:Tfp pilus assembly protein PilF
LLTDRYGLSVSTSSIAARDAYVEGYDLMFTFWPGAADAFSRATAEDPNFALAYLGTAQIAAATGDFPTMQSALAAAKAAAVKLPAREASHLGFFELMLTGQSDAAIDAAGRHLAEWPRDAAVMNQYGPVLGLISLSGRPHVKRAQEAVLDAFARYYPDDGWYLAHHAMALSEVGRRDEARVLSDRSLALNPRNAIAAHSCGHIAYEDGDADYARSFLTYWLATYPRNGFLSGHLYWHLAISELGAGNAEAAFRIYTETIAPGAHQGILRSRIYDAVQFLWRWELAGNPRDPSRWQAIDALAHALLPHAAHAFSDFHILMADAVAGDDSALSVRLQRMDALTQTGRYAGDGVVQKVAKGLAAYAQADYAGAIATLMPLLLETERLGGGSRAQHDLVDFTVLRACVLTGRHDEMQRLLTTRRAGPGPVPVAGLH